MTTPNTQNILIQINPVSLLPEKILLRDLSDSHFYAPAINAIEKENEFGLAMPEEYLPPKDNGKTNQLKLSF